MLFFLTTSMIHQLLHPPPSILYSQPSIPPSLHPPSLRPPSSTLRPHPSTLHPVCRMEDNRPWRSRMNDGNKSAALSSCRFTFSLLPSDLRQTTSLIVPERSPAQPRRNGPSRAESNRAGPSRAKRVRVDRLISDKYEINTN